MQVFLIVALIILLSIAFYFYLQFKSSQQQIKKQQQQLKKMIEQQNSNFKKAKKIHQNSLPDNLPEKDDLSVAAFYQPAEELGGDYYNIFQIDHGSMDIFFDQYFIYMFDVSGHGIDSAMLSIFINNTIEDYFRLQHTQGEEVSPQKILNYITEQYRAENYPDDYLVCLFAGVLELNNYKFTYSSSGFHFPFYKVSKTGELAEIKTGGLPISSSIDKSFVELEETTIDFKQDEFMFFTTDGLLEQVTNSTRYGGQLEQKLKDINYFHPAFLVESIKRDFANFTGSEYGDDDITYLAIGRLDSKLKEWSITAKQQDFKVKKQEIINYLTFINSDITPIKEAFSKLATSIWQCVPELKVKVLITPEYLMISINIQQSQIDWHELIASKLDQGKLNQKIIEVFPSNKNNNQLYLFQKIT
ncbi:MAG: PP2C family protein-serine/threonine phosphatase [Bacillota bacterium]